MSEVWSTKYGLRRVRRDPPALEEAIAAAQGLTDDVEHQAQFAAELMGVPVAEVETEIRKAAAVRRKQITLTSVDRKGMSRAVIVERRPSRSFAAGRTLRG